MITGEEIRRKRKELGLTQKELAKKVGVSFQTLNGYENGKKIPSTKYQILNKILHQINVFDTQSDTTNKKTDVMENTNGNKFISMPDGSLMIQVPLISFNAYASFLEVYEDEYKVQEEFENTYFTVDKIGRGRYVAFTVKNDSMNGGSLDDTPSGAQVLARELGRHHWKDGFNHTPYGWIIICTTGIFHKDIKKLDNQTGDIICSSRSSSPEFPDFVLNLNDVHSIYKVIKRTF